MRYASGPCCNDPHTSECGAALHRGNPRRGASESVPSARASIWSMGYGRERSCVEWSVAHRVPFPKPRTGSVPLARRRKRPLLARSLCAGYDAGATQRLPCAASQVVWGQEHSLRNCKCSVARLRQRLSLPGH
jgi:hypothetical protein